MKVGRFALKSLDLANFLRMAALFSNPAQPPSPDQLLGLFPLIEGVEVKGFVAPFKNTGSSSPSTPSIWTGASLSDRSRARRV